MWLKKRKNKYVLLFGCLFFSTLILGQKESDSLQIIDWMERVENKKSEYEGFQPIPFQAPDLEGENHFLANYEGQILILHFWELYCEPCRSQIPSLYRILDDYDDQSVAVLSFVNQFGEELEDYVNKQKFINFPIIPNSRSLSMDAFAGEMGYPRIFVIDKYGIIQKLIIGGSSYDEMHLYDEIQPLIEKYLKE